MNSPGTAPDPGDVEYMDEFYPPRILLTCQKVGPQLQQTLRTEVKVLEGDREEIWKFLLQVILQHVSTPMTEGQHLQVGNGATDGKNTIITSRWAMSCTFLCCSRLV